MIGAGCTTVPQPLKTYAAAELPPQAVARIAGEPGQPSGGVFIACMDSVSLERFWGAYDNGGRWPNKLTVIPGRHYLAVVYDFPRGQKASWAKVSLDVEAGRSYLVKKQTKGDWVEMWVEDSATGAVVARAMRWRQRTPVDPCP